MSETEQSVICGNCGAPNRADAEVCAVCGATLAAYRSIASAPSGAEVATPGSAPVDLPSASVEVTPEPVSPPEPLTAAPAVSTTVASRDTRPTAHFHHVTYTRPDAASSHLEMRPPDSRPDTSALAAADAPRGEEPSPPASSVTFTAAPVPPAHPTTTRNDGAAPARSQKVEAAPPPAPQRARDGQRANGQPDQRAQKRPEPAPALRPPDQRRPDRLARTSGSTLITWGVGLVLFGFIISIALPNASHQALGEVIVTLATVVGIVLFIVGLTHRTGARRPGDRRPPRRRR